jgi:hypothetical protein
MANILLATDFLHWLHQREETQDNPSTLQHFHEAYRRLTTFVRQADLTTQNSLLETLKQGLSSEPSNWEFGCIANTCGMIVEAGSDPSLTIEPILDRMTEQLVQVPKLVEVMRTKLGVEEPHSVRENDWAVLGAAHPEDAWVIGEWLALRFTGCAAMTMLCRDMTLRQKARERIELLHRAQAVQSENPFAYYLAELLGMVDDAHLLILDTTRQLGFRVRLTAVRNNFHLFTLLQDALLTHDSARDWPGAKARPLAVSVAKSERMLSEISPNEWAAENRSNENGVHDTAIWSYHTYLGQGAPIWGEMKPTEIPMLDSERIVLLGPLDAQRSWEVSFFSPLHPALRSKVIVEEVLKETQYQGWIRNISESAG